MMLLYLAANIQKIPLKAKRMGKKVALSSNFNILTAKKVLQEYNFFRKLAPSLSNNKDTANS
jgi:hypothetical protein